MERKITLSQKQLNTYGIMQKYIEGAITRERTAEILGISQRQVTRKKKGIIKHGAESLIHKNTGRKPAHTTKKEMAEEILKIFGEPINEGINFSHFQDILVDEHAITVSYTCLYNILKRAGKESPRSKKHKEKQYRRRERKEHPGELLQIDATPYDWVGTGIKYSLHGAIDDATGNIFGLYMCKNECLHGYLEMMRDGITTVGVPQTLYSDKHTIFRSPKTGKLTVEEIINGKQVNLTQFGRAMNELGIDIIYADSAQAKGRVERMWNTLQDRLPVEFRRKGISSVEETNEFLSMKYIKKFNEKFAVSAKGASLFIPLREDINIDTILCIKQPRKLQKRHRNKKML